MDRVEKEEYTADFIGRISSRPRIPRATYRVQFQPAFKVREAEKLVPYLQDLGISDCYASPLFQPCFEESHGYDICDFQQLNPAAGTEEDFQSLSAALHEAEMGLILDVVPNHMGISGHRNAWWLDVLENGPSSKYSCYFDIDWHPAKPELENKVLLPILEDPYGKVLESGKLRLSLEEGAFFIQYYENRLPVDPQTYSRVLNYSLKNLNEFLGKENPYLQELQSILTALSYLPGRTEAGLEKLEERYREKEIIKKRIAALNRDCPEVRRILEETIQIFNGRPGDPHSFDLLDTLLKEQAYRPAFWRVAADEINYRRFFDINSLAAIRTELTDVFWKGHRLIFQWLLEGKAQGLRVDHPDGLWNPYRYFRRLQAEWIRQQIEKQAVSDPGRASSPSLEKIDEGLSKIISGPESDSRREFVPWPLYVVAEKILSAGEALPGDWAVYGTTGYEFLNEVNGLFVDPRNSLVFEKIYSHFIGQQIRFDHLVNASKKMIMLVSLASEIHALSYQLERISEKNRQYQDFTLNSLTFAIREIIACLAVYRTYITEDGRVTPRDQSYIEAATEEAKRQNPRTASILFDFVRDTLLQKNTQDFPPEDRAKLIAFTLKFQQITGPVMAKGLEDTAFYVYNRLISLNEVGGHPGRFGTSSLEFHGQNKDRLHLWPYSFLTTSTHDTKRGEDVRARINVLSEIPGEWRAALSRWSRINSYKKVLVDGDPAPSRNDEYLLYQTLVGAWPGEETSKADFEQFRKRIADYMHKATLEAKVHTSWVNPNKEYDGAVRQFVFQILDPSRRNHFPRNFTIFQRRVAFFGRLNSLAQTLLKLTCPGVPDLYQGTELWDLNLVDPDNRRPVDYGRRQALLNDLRRKSAQGKEHLLSLAKELLATPSDGRIKLYIIYRLLEFRRHNPDLLGRGEYHPLEGVGEKKDHLVAFARLWMGKKLMVLTPRLVVGLTGGAEQPPLGEECWKDTRISVPISWKDQIFRNLFTGEEVPIEEEKGICGLALKSGLKNFPVAALEHME